MVCHREKGQFSVFSYFENLYDRVCYALFAIFKHSRNLLLFILPFYFFFAKQPYWFLLLVPCSLSFRAYD